MAKKKRILMVAAENDALPGAKVGGVGDVLRDLPRALVREGALVDCAIPSYGFLARLEGVVNLGSVEVNFASALYKVEILVLRASDENGSDIYILHHDLFSIKGESVYYHDTDNRPFASDANKFAFFCAALAEVLVQGKIPRPDVLHCHDWHTAYLLILQKFSLSCLPLKDIKTVFTIHNLAMQGIRPFSGDESSFHAWFPTLRYSIDKVVDPRYHDCINPMRAGVLLADKVHTVSPTYAHEILHASRHEEGIYGGDGLENDLQRRDDRSELAGILNGCEYPQDVDYTPLSRSALIALMLSSIRLWASKEQRLGSAHWLAEKSVHRWQKAKTKGIVVTSVGRLTEQKMRVLHTPMGEDKTALQGLLDVLGDSGVLIMLGSGDPQLERFVAQVSADHDNLIFLNGYSDELSKALYNFGDLFLMPSSFEPCGISQMLSMRAGQPCLVNAVGGLKDTVDHMRTGFVFSGETVEEQAAALVDLFEQALTLFREDKTAWKNISRAAASMRFTWEGVADDYLDELYS